MSAIQRLSPAAARKRSPFAAGSVRDRRDSLEASRRDPTGCAAEGLRAGSPRGFDSRPARRIGSKGASPGPFRLELTLADCQGVARLGLRRRA